MAKKEVRKICLDNGCDKKAKVRKVLGEGVTSIFTYSRCKEHHKEWLKKWKKNRHKKK